MVGPSGSFISSVQYALVVDSVGITWQLDPLAIVGLLFAVFSYAAGVHRLALRGRRWPLRRTVPYMAGVLMIAIATQSPLAALDTKLFSAHVIQHLLLAMAGPILLALGAPLTLFLQAAPRRAQSRLLKILHTRPVKVITFPVVSWMIFVGSLFILYYTGLYDLSLRNRFFHDLVHLHFVLSGFLFFAPVVAIDPHPWRMPHGARLLYVGLTLPAHAFLALALMSATNPLAADWYLIETARTLDEILRDQKVGATIMWVAGDLIAIATVAVVATQWAKQEDRYSAREDRYVDLQRAGARLGLVERGSIEPNPGSE